MKEKRASTKEPTHVPEEETDAPLNSKLEGFFFKMRTLEVENEELKQEIQSHTFRAKEEAADVSPQMQQHVQSCRCHFYAD
jgi:hypothetical protein